MSKASPQGTQRMVEQTGTGIFATVLFDVKINFSPTLGTLHLQENVQAELGARLLKNHLQESSRCLNSGGNVS